MELEKAIEMLKNERHELSLYADGEKVKLGFAIETVLQALEQEQENNLLSRIREKKLQEELKNSIPKKKIEDKIKELNKEEQNLQNSISDEEREDYSDANISFNLMDMEIRRKILQELLEEK